MPKKLEKLDTQRRVLDYEKQYIAKRMHCSPGKISTIFSGYRPPRLDDIWELMDILHIPPEQMHEYFPRPPKEGKR